MSPGPPRRIVAAIRLIHPFPVTVVVLTTLLLVAVAHGGNPGAGFLARAAEYEEAATIPRLLVLVAVRAPTDWQTGLPG